METINTKERIEVISTGKHTNKKGKPILGAKGKRFSCHPKVAEKFFINGWIEDFTGGKKEKKDDKK